MLNRKMSSKEDDLKGRQPYKKTKSQEDEVTGRKFNGQLPQMKTISQEADIAGGRTQRTTLQEVNLTERQLYPTPLPSGFL